MQVLLSIKMAGHIKKRSISVKGNNVSESFEHCGNGLYFKTLVLKHVKQKTVKLQENIASPEANI
jgi:hypothetical protein